MFASGKFSVRGLHVVLFQRVLVRCRPEDFLHIFPKPGRAVSTPLGMLATNHSIGLEAKKEKNQQPLSSQSHVFCPVKLPGRLQSEGTREAPPHPCPCGFPTRSVGLCVSVSEEPGLFVPPSRLRLCLFPSLCGSCLGSGTAWCIHPDFLTISTGRRKGPAQKNAQSEARISW